MIQNKQTNHCDFKNFCRVWRLLNNLRECAHLALDVSQHTESVDWCFKKSPRSSRSRMESLGCSIEFFR